MNPPRRRLLGFAALLAPLAILAVFGSAELGRQSERAERALTDQARDFLREARNDLERTLARTEQLLAGVPDLGRVRAAVAARILRGQDEAVLDLVVLDDGGALLYPKTAPRENESLPFQRPSAISEIRKAEVLELLGDLEGARNLLWTVVDRPIEEGSRFVSRENVTLRAHFALAGVLRRLGDVDAAEEHYLLASIEAAGDHRRWGSNSSRATVTLWCEIALAEIDVEQGRGLEHAVGLAQEIADGVHDAVAEPMLEVVVAELAELVRHNPSALRGVRTASAANRTRRAGRAFAGEYSAFLRETVRRRLQRADGERVQVVHSTRDGTSILTLRPALDEERRATLDEPDGCAWVGLRIDLDQIVAESLAERLAASAGPFALVIADGEGSPIAPPPETAPSGIEPRAEVTTDSGIRLSAVPLDADALVAERSRSIRNRALLVLMLCAVAGGGALLLIRSVARESELAELKVALVSRMTHDLKTPLALIRMYAETIERGRARSPDEASRFAGIVLREADALTRMVERVLDFSRSQAGTLSYAPRSVDLVESLRVLADAFRPNAEARGFELRTSLPDEAVHTRVDPGALESAVLDLLENSVKYTAPDGDDRGIELHLDHDTETATITVLDRGIGIPDGEHARIFDSFFRGSNAGEARGAGLGLALLRHFAEAHAGSARAESRPGGGTAVHLTLRREPEHPHEQD